MSRGTVREDYAAEELTAACLVNAGRWEEVDRHFDEGGGSVCSAAVAVGLGIARIRLGRWTRALDGLLEALKKFAEDQTLRKLTVEAHMAWAAERMQAKDWEPAASALEMALNLDPGHTQALRLLSSLRAAAPMARLFSGQRAETAAMWEREFVQDRKTETAHHLAILYYWWAVNESPVDTARAASLWQRAIGCWVYVLNDWAYWVAWLSRRKTAYEPDPEAVAGLQAAVRKDLTTQITLLASVSDTGQQRCIEDLAMDCWAEFEVAALLREAGISAPYGPLLMDLLGCPREQTRSHDPEKGPIRLGECDLPFVPDIEALFALYRAGLTRGIAYLANGSYERAESIVRGKIRTVAERESPARIVGEMLAYVRIRRAEEYYVRLKCPPEHAPFQSVLDYAQSISGLIESIREVRGAIVTVDTGQSLKRFVELVCRRTYNEFTSFEAEAAERAHVLETGIQLLDNCLRLVGSVQGIEEAQLHLAAMVNRLALQIDKEAHDRVIELLEWAARLAPENPNYRRNLAFSYFNRYASRKRRDVDMAEAREDILKAYHLAPYDTDIRSEYQQMVGWGRV